ncbi:uncharacterized protein si:dkeyp-97a10.2 [Synchiropus splendidus]|uniref:uncharacterized protein si:dkeyp-97a10.2 n=1 Tax=Synchiropus splendidus TaxID=270530 RepID=UPI00237EE3F0|nr:uncharacterized protein si:dkeyp-97a10.2 [Synchiropus splendidus]XP_053737489.1 uncharacterized protein si:dkeyp-97a10.2 [Synchiropus splendidus]
MAGRRSLPWTVAPLLLQLSLSVHSVQVHISNDGPVYVIPGSTLLLRARVEYGPLEKLSEITWEREAESGLGPGKETLATCPGAASACSGTKPNVHASIQQQELTLQISSYSGEDGGVYTVSVKDQTVATTTAHCIVREYEEVHHVTVSLNVTHSWLICGEAWGTEPHFSWLHERAAVTKTVGEVSKDGSILVVTMAPMCGHFTCLVSNKRGYSSATYTAGPCEKEGVGMTAVVACLVVLVLLLGSALAIVLWRRQRLSSRGERLHEHLDDPI